MLDVIETSGTAHKRFLVYETHYPLFNDKDGSYKAIRFLIVASVTYNREGKLFDWAAYMGCVPQDWGKEYGMSAVSSHGNKLSIREVKFYLYGQPSLSRLLPRYRE